MQQICKECFGKAFHCLVICIGGLFLTVCLQTVQGCSDVIESVSPAVQEIDTSTHTTCDENGELPSIIMYEDEIYYCWNRQSVSSSNDIEIVGQITEYNETARINISGMKNLQTNDTNYLNADIGRYQDMLMVRRKNHKRWEYLDK